MSIPRPVIDRLPKYLAYLRAYRVENGDDAKYLCSHEIARALGLTTSTVRQDFTHLDFHGSSRRGYDVGDAEQVLIDVLGVESEKSCVVVGAGNLGRALAMHGSFGRYGFRIAGIFDNDSSVIGQSAGEFVVQDVEGLPDFVQDNDIDIGVIAVPSASAQIAADRLIMAGVQGLLNLAFTRVVSPRKVPVVDGRIVASLLQLSCVMGMNPPDDSADEPDGQTP